jgi:lysophospholipase L1-like esterase
MDQVGVGARGRRARSKRLAVAGLGAVGALALEAAWVVRRDLPSFEGGDASGALLAPDGARSSVRPLRLVALGDSTLTGPGLDEPREVWLWQALGQLERTRAIEVRSLAVGGSRAADVRRQAIAARAQQVDLAVVAVGSNDAIRATPRAAFARDLQAAIATLREGGAVVAVCNVGDLGSLERVPQPLASVLGARAAVVRRQIEAIVARHRGVVLLDVASSDEGFRAGGVFVADRFHPNAAGHRLWADAAVPGLQRALRLAEGAIDLEERDAAAGSAPSDPVRGRVPAPREGSSPH